MSEQTEAHSDRGGALRALGLAATSWLIPGLGHIFLGLRRKGVTFLAVVLVALVIGCQLQGNLYRALPGQPLTLLGTLASLGAGVPYLALRFLLHYQGDVMARGYEYGTAFLVTAGLMNWLVVLDVWDRARPEQEVREESEK